jgi:subtilisin family serine protease
VSIVNSLPKRRALLPVWLAVALAVLPYSLPEWSSLQGFGATAALADDDDDDFEYDDDDDDDDRPRARPAARAAPRSAPRPAPLPDRAPDEIVAAGVTAPQLALLEAGGFTVLERTEAEGLGGEVLRLRIPPDTELDAARDTVVATAPQSLADFSHYYRSEAGGACTGPHCAAAQLIGWPAASVPVPGCGWSTDIGLIDTAINPGHAAFAGGQVEVIRLSDAALPESGRQHGTAVAAILAGAAGGRVPGLLPGARVVAVDAFYRGGRRDDRSGAFELIRALDQLSQRGVTVVNMSLAGPPNILLERLVATLSADGMVIVAAAGNAGPAAPPAYPAAYADVIAVTAVDRSRRAYRRAGRGDHIDLAAPGVDVWTAASVSGGRAKTGTSFAAPFVTAAVALLKAGRPEANSAEILETLGRSAQDLGEPGKDAIFGWGLVNAGAACADAAKRT